MSRTIHSREDVEVDEWKRPSQCPVCGPDSDVRVAAVVRPITYSCFDCEAAWTRSTFNEVGDGRRV